MYHSFYISYLIPQLIFHSNSAWGTFIEIVAPFKYFTHVISKKVALIESVQSYTQVKFATHSAQYSMPFSTHTFFFTRLKVERKSKLRFKNS